MGLDDGCSEDREQEIHVSVMLRYPQKSSDRFQYTYSKVCTQRSLTSLDGDPVGTSVGFRGAFEGD